MYIEIAGMTDDELCKVRDDRTLVYDIDGELCMSLGWKCQPNRVRQIAQEANAAYLDGVAAGRRLMACELRRMLGAAEAPTE